MKNRMLFAVALAGLLLPATAFAAPNYCIINGVQYMMGDVDPANACHVCSPGQIYTAWSAVPDGTTCDDGDACTMDDACTAGDCGGIALTTPECLPDMGPADVGVAADVGVDMGSGSDAGFEPDAGPADMGTTSAPDMGEEPVSEPDAGSAAPDASTNSPADTGAGGERAADDIASDEGCSQVGAGKTAAPGLLLAVICGALTRKRQRRTS